MRCPIPAAGAYLIVDDRPSSYERIADGAAAEHAVEIEPDPHQALFRAADGNYDLAIVSLDLANFDALRLAANCARSTAPGICPFSLSPNPTTMRAWRAGSRSASTII